MCFHEIVAKQREARRQEEWIASLEEHFAPVEWQHTGSCGLGIIAQQELQVVFGLNRDLDSTGQVRGALRLRREARKQSACAEVKQLPIKWQRRTNICN